MKIGHLCPPSPQHRTLVELILSRFFNGKESISAHNTRSPPPAPRTLYVSTNIRGHLSKQTTVETPSSVQGCDKDSNFITNIDQEGDTQTLPLTLTPTPS